MCAPPLVGTFRDFAAVTIGVESQRALSKQREEKIALDRSRASACFTSRVTMFV